MYSSLQVTYKSLVDWKYKTNYLHCSPNFHGHARYDFLIIETTEKPFFAQHISVPTALDHHLQLHYVHSQSRAKAEFISVKSIIRGCVIVTDPTKPDHGVILDVLDTDMFLRVRSIK